MKRFGLVIAVCAVGLAARTIAATVWIPHAERAADVRSDPDHYGGLAASLIDRGELGFDPPGASPTTLRGPGFPAWLAIGMAAGRSVRWLGLWASLPGIITAVCIAIMLQRSHGGTAAITGGLIAATHPLSCFVSGRLLPDEFYGALLFIGLVAWRAATNVRRTYDLVGWSAAAGVAIGIASLTRVTAVGVLAILAIVSLSSGGGGGVHASHWRSSSAPRFFRLGPGSRGRLSSAVV